MDRIKHMFRGNGGNEPDAESSPSKSSNDISAAAVVLGNNDTTSSSSSSRAAVTFEVVESSAAAADDDEPSEDNEGDNMLGVGGMAYLTQPDAELDGNSLCDEQSSQDGEGEEEDDEQQQHDNKETHSRHQSKKERRGKRQGGCYLGKLSLRSSPEEGRHNHSATAVVKSPHPSFLSQSLALTMESPLRSPSPLMMMSHNMQQSPLLDSSAIEESGKATSDINAKLCAPNDAMGIDEKNDMDLGITEPIIDDEATINEEQQQQKKHCLHQMNMKKQAIFRSLLHLSDNSYSFVYEDSNGGSETKNDDDDGDEQGLPFIGPGLKSQYEDLEMLLQKGLLGNIGGDSIDSSPNDKDDNTKSTGEESKDNGQSSGSNSNPFLPRIKSNVSALLMGERGHGKTLVLERCLASLSRLAGKRKERLLEKMLKEQPDKAEEMYTQASFRVVRLNGLLYQGDSAVACTREIARQIGVMSREERKRTRRIMKQMGVAKRTRLSKKLQSSSDMETPKSSKRQRKKERSGKKSGQKELAFLTSPVTPLLHHDQTQTPDNPESHQFRIRQSGFNTYIALLDEVLRTARIDGIPILIVLEELDTFLAGGRTSNLLHSMTDSSDGGNHFQQDGGSNDRQLLLYHLLDRVADHKFLVSLVGITTNLTTINQLEKRVQSRAEGTSKIIYFGHNSSYDVLVESLLGKFYTPPATGESMEDEYNEQKAMIDIRKEVAVILRGGKSNDDENNLEENDEEINDFALIQRVLQRNYELGLDMRWMCRVFDVALGLLTSDIDEHMYQFMEHAEGGLNKEGCDSIPKLSPRHMAQALVTMSASLEDVSNAIGRPDINTLSALELIRWGQLLGDPKHYSCVIGTHPRLAALLDLSGPQIAVLLSARRITARDDTRANAEDELENMRTKGSSGEATTTTSISLTYQRIQDEYSTSFVASGRYTISSDRYPPHVLYRSCMDLMELDIIRLKKELCVGGALQYKQNDALSAGTNITNLPLHVNLEWELEFMGALKASLLQCSTALREWGMKMN